MDYNKKGVKWYWIALLVLLSCAAMASVLWANPYLYSQVELQRALIGRKSDQPTRVVLTKTQRPGNDEPLAQAQYLWGPTRTSVDPVEVTRNRRFVEESSSQVQLPPDFKVQNWYSDTKGILFFNASGDIVSVDWEGFVKWTFKPHKKMQFLKPLLLQESILLAAKEGYFYSLKRDSGELNWFSPLAQEIFSSPLFIEGGLYLALKPYTRDLNNTQKEVSSEEDTAPGIAEIEISDGSWKRISKAFSFEREVFWSFRDKESFYLTHDKTLFEVNFKDLSVKRKKEFESKIISEVMLLDKNIIVPTQDGRVFGLSYSFNSDYESDIGHPLGSPLLYSPIFDRAAIVAENGYLHVIGAESGNRRWRFNLQNESPSNLGWSSRLNGKHIQELNLGWRYKGWSLWIPCVRERICIFNPDEGQIVGRILLSGAYTGLPYIEDKSFWFILKDGEQWKITKQIEKALAD